MAIAFVTGASGFIGSHLVPALLERGFEVRCLIRPPSNLQWLPLDRISLFTADPVVPFDFSQALQGVDIVFHLAGVTKTLYEKEYQENNVNLTRRLLDAIRLHAPGLRRLVITSSQAAAGPSAPGQVKDEGSECRPVTYYGASKLDAERLLAHYPDIPTVILRPASVYGPRDRDVLLLIKTIRRGLAPVIGSPDRCLTWVHVADVIQAQLLAAESPQAAGQTYFVTDGHMYTWRETQAAIEKILGRKALSLPIPMPVVYILAAISDVWARLTGSISIFNLNKCKEIVEQNWGCSCDKIRCDLCYRARFGLEDGLRDTIAWAKTEGWL
ncbi:NAD-dependent epimerase/dehydratase family protein [candidate division FCPU426 bacterium]|nr:NAD-dependent epimerase/dehydratase family protein [candidate division FCPU426 bacterium]